MAIGDTAALLRSIRGHTLIPRGQATYDDVTTLEVATEELYAYLLPTLMQERQEFYTGAPGVVRYTVVEGQALYAIPARAVGAKIRSARLLDSLGNPYPLAYYEVEQVKREVDSGRSSGVVLEGSSLRLFPTPRGLVGYTLEVATYLRPAALVVGTECPPLTEILAPVDGYTTAYLLTANAPAGLRDLSWVFADVVSSTSPFESRFIECTLYEVEEGVGAGGDYTRVVLEGTLTGLMLGDYLCRAGTAPVVQAPLEWHPLLSLAVSARQLASIGDLQMAQAKVGAMKAMESRVPVTVRPRREDAGRKVSNGTNKWRSGFGGL